VATSGTATTSVASSPSSAPKVGSTLRITDPGYGAVILVTVSPPSPAQPSQYATVKGTLQAVTVTIHTVSGTFGANPLYFSARTAAGDSMNADLGGTDNQLATADVAAGQKLRGPVAFDVPKGQTIALIVMAAPFGSQMGTWTA